MTDKVVNFTGITKLPIDPARILSEACKVEFDRVLIIGIRKEDESEYFASSDPDGGTVLWDMERARHKLMKIVDDD